MEPAEVRVRPPGLATNQRGVGHVDADWNVVHRLYKVGQKKEKNFKKIRGDKDGGKNSEPGLETRGDGKRSAVGIHLLYNKNNDTWLSKRV